MVPLGQVVTNGVGQSFISRCSYITYHVCTAFLYFRRRYADMYICSMYSCTVYLQHVLLYRISAACTPVLYICSMYSCTVYLQHVLLYCISAACTPVLYICSMYSCTVYLQHVLLYRISVVVVNFVESKSRSSS